MAVSFLFPCLQLFNTNFFVQKTHTKSFFQHEKTRYARKKEENDGGRWIKVLHTFAFCWAADGRHDTFAASLAALPTIYYKRYFFGLPTIVQDRRKNTQMQMKWDDTG